MNAPAHETVVVAVNGSSASAAAVQWAAAEAGRRHARLHAVHVVGGGRPESTPPGADPRAELQDARQLIPGRVGGWVARAGVEVDLAVSVVSGDLAGQVEREARDAAVLVLGAPDGPQHHGLPEELSGSCLCPVVVVDREGDATFLEAPDTYRTPSVPDHTLPRASGADHARP